MKLAGIHDLKERFPFPEINQFPTDASCSDRLQTERRKSQFSERRGLSCHDPLLSVYGH